MNHLFYHKVYFVRKNKQKQNPMFYSQNCVIFFFLHFYIFLHTPHFFYKTLCRKLEFLEFFYNSTLFLKKKSNPLQFFNLRKFHKSRAT